MKIQAVIASLKDLEQHELPFVAAVKYMELNDQDTIEVLRKSPWFRDEWLESWMSDKASSFLSFIKESDRKHTLFDLFKIGKPPGGIITDAKQNLDPQLDIYLRDGRNIDALVKKDKDKISENLASLNNKTINLINQITLYIKQFHEQNSFYENLQNTQDIQTRYEYDQSKKQAVTQIELLSKLEEPLLPILEQITKHKLPGRYISFRNRMQKIHEAISSITTTLGHQHPSNSTASSSNHTQSPLAGMDHTKLIKFNEIQNLLRETCASDIEKLRKLIQKSLCGIANLDFTNTNKLKLWLTNLDGCNSLQAWNWDDINKQCQRLKLYRMMQTDSQGRLYTSDHVDLQSQDYSVREEVFFKLLTTIIDTQGQQSLILNKSDLFLLKSLNDKYWQSEDLLVGCHAIHVLANCGEWGAGNVVLNHCKLLQKIITEQPRLCDLRVDGSTLSPHTKWNLLNFMLYHCMRVTAKHTYTITLMENAYPGLISLIKTIKQLRPNYIQLLGQDDFKKLSSDLPKDNSCKLKDKYSLANQFFLYASCKLYQNGTTLDIVGYRTTPKSNSIALIPIEAFYEEIPKELFFIDQDQFRNIKKIIDALQIKAKNTVRSTTGNKRSNPFKPHDGSGSSQATSEPRGKPQRQLTSHTKLDLPEQATLTSPTHAHASSSKRNSPSIVSDIIQLINDLKQWQKECQPNFKQNLFVNTRLSSMATTSSSGESKTLSIDPNHEPKKRFMQLQKRVIDILQPDNFNQHATFHKSASVGHSGEPRTTDSPESSKEAMQQKCSLLIQQLTARLQSEQKKRPPKKRIKGNFTSRV